MIAWASFIVMLKRYGGPVLSMARKHGAVILAVIVLVIVTLRAARQEGN